MAKSDSTRLEVTPYRPESLNERFETACALAARLYAEGKDTTEADALVDRLMAELERAS